MKRDLDLVRQILMACESNDSGCAPDRLQMPGYTEEQVGFHIHLMGEAGLLAVVDITSRGCRSPQAAAVGITWKGYEFLDASRHEGNWKRAKGAACAAGGIGLDIMKSVLTAMATDAAKKSLGLP